MRIQPCVRRWVWLRRRALPLMFFCLGHGTGKIIREKYAYRYLVSSGHVLDLVFVQGAANSCPEIFRRGESEHFHSLAPVSYTHLRAHETQANLVCRLLLEKKNESGTMAKAGKGLLEDTLQAQTSAVSD